jgi:hypothetical protein
MKTLKILSVVCFGLLAIACNKKQSLQEYYVSNQENKDFLAVDIPASMFSNAESLNPEQQKTLESIKKINVLAIPIKDENKEIINSEKTNISEILKDEKYQLLMKYGGGNAGFEVYYTGDEEAVDEIIVYGFDENRGMGMARILGDNMNPSDILAFIKSLDKDDLDMDGLKGITNMFTEKHVSK